MDLDLGFRNVCFAAISVHSKDGSCSCVIHRNVPRKENLIREVSFGIVYAKMLQTHIIEARK